MKVYKLSEQERAATGWTHCAHFKVADGDIDAANEITNIIAIPVGSVAGRASFHTLTAWNNTTPTVDVGIAASGVTGDTLLDGAAVDTAGATAYGGTNALHYTVNNTASRFITIKQLGTGTATAGEGKLYFTLIDTATFTNTPGAA